MSAVLKLDSLIVFLDKVTQPIFHRGVALKKGDIKIAKNSPTLPFTSSYSWNMDAFSLWRRRFSVEKTGNVA